jgi:hypothetical protein
VLGIDVLQLDADGRICAITVLSGLLDSLDGRGDDVAGSDGREEPHVQLEEDAARTGELFGHHRVQQRRRDTALDDETTERCPGGETFVVVDRVAVAGDLGEQLDVASADLTRPARGLTHYWSGALPRGSSHHVAPPVAYLEAGVPARSRQGRAF